MIAKIGWSRRRSAAGSNSARVEQSGTDGAVGQLAPDAGHGAKPGTPRRGEGVVKRVPQPCGRAGAEYLNGLECLWDEGLDRLRALWTELYGASPSPRISRDILVRACAYRIQKQAYGELPNAFKRELARYATEVERKGAITHNQAKALAPGVCLVREWQGRTQRVEVTANGFVWSGKSFRSLSEVARAITGTHWSGPRFFGLDPKRPAGPMPRKKGKGDG
jgi:hypothetical protein